MGAPCWLLYGAIHTFAMYTESDALSLSGSLFGEGHFNPPQFLKDRGEENKRVHGLQSASV